MAAMLKNIFQNTTLPKIYIMAFLSLIVFSFAFFASAEDFTGTDKNIFQDSDQDGLSNEEERLYGTDPFKADTDSDGYSDGAEVKGGYDPLKSAPGDKLVAVETSDDFGGESDTVQASQNSTTTSNNGEQKVNLTQVVSQQVAASVKQSSSSGESLSMEDLQSNIQQVLNDNQTIDTFPEIDEKDIKIKKQDYDNLPEAERKEKIKSDTNEYVTAVTYILMSNSPISANTVGDLEKATTSLVSQSMGIFSGSNTTLLNDFFEKGLKAQEQLKAVEVPENMLDSHKKALQIAAFAITMKDGLTSTSNDPLASIGVLTKIQALLGITAGFVAEMQTTLADYGVQEIPVQPQE